MSSNSYGYKQINDVSVSNVCATAKAALGDRTIWKGNEYVYVYNAGGEEIGKGLGCCYSAVSGYSVTVSSVTEVNECAGICVNATFTTDTYGWILVKGFANVEVADGAAIGDRLMIGTDGEQVVVVGGTATVAEPRMHGIVLDTIASGASGLAKVSCYS